MTNALDLSFDAGLSALASDTVLLYVTLTGMAFHDEYVIVDVGAIRRDGATFHLPYLTREVRNMDSQIVRNMMRQDKAG